MKQRRKKLTNLEKLQIKNLSHYKTKEEIMREFNISHSTYYNVLREESSVETYLRNIIKKNIKSQQLGSNEKFSKEEDIIILSLIEEIKKEME